MNFKLYENSSLAEGCTIALENRLYVNPSWELIKLLQDGLVYGANSRLALAFDRDKAVGLVIEDLNSRDFMAYTKTAYRRQGIASRCYQTLIKKYLIEEGEVPHRNAYEGIRGSRSFWNSLNVQVF